MIKILQVSHLVESIYETRSTNSLNPFPLLHQQHLLQRYRYVSPYTHQVRTTRRVFQPCCKVNKCKFYISALTASVCPLDNVCRVESFKNSQQTPKTGRLQQQPQLQAASLAAASVASRTRIELSAVPWFFRHKQSPFYRVHLGAVPQICPRISCSFEFSADSLVQGCAAV